MDLSRVHVMQLAIGVALWVASIVCVLLLYKPGTKAQRESDFAAWRAPHVKIPVTWIGR